MTRYAVSTREVYHLWANQAQAYAHANSARFDGVHAYSYAAEIGRIVTNSRGETAYLVNTFRYSSTTDRHQSYLHRAIPAGATIFAHDSIMDAPEAVLRIMIEELPEMKLTADRARQNKQWRLQALAARVALINDFAAFFDLPHTPIVMENLDSELAEATAKIQEERKEKRKREVAAEAKRQAELLTALPRWLNGETVYHSLSSLPAAYLRLRPNCPEETETTQGAVVPTSHVRKALPIVLKRISQVSSDSGCHEFVPGSVYIGHYTLNRIEADGTVVVGCHRFSAEEVRRFAGVLETTL